MSLSAKREAMACHQLALEDDSTAVLSKAVEIMNIEMPQHNNGDLGSGWAAWGHRPYALERDKASFFGLYLIYALLVGMGLVAAANKLLEQRRAKGAVG